MSKLNSSFLEALALLQDSVKDPTFLETADILANQIAQCFQRGNKVLIMGNGGSACDAMHFAEEFTGRFRNDRPALPVIAITDGSHITCVGNDYGFEFVFSRGVEAYATAGDIVIGLSTSGNSANIIRAFEAARKKQAKTMALLGKDGGLLRGCCDWELIIPGKNSDRIQEIHMLFLHVVIEGVERILYPALYGMDE